MIPDPTGFVARCDVIDFDSPEIIKKAAQLRGDDDVATARNCFEFVRDEIKHSSDYRLNPVTCTASDVLKHGTGYCYAKSHLLCALLRANQIPAGLCYQRLTISDENGPHCLHGLNAIFLPDYGWYRVDARGNRKGVDARFDPPNERLAFTTDLSGEKDLPEIHASPRAEIIQCLTSFETWDQVYDNLPDI